MGKVTIFIYNPMHRSIRQNPTWEPLSSLRMSLTSHTPSLVSHALTDSSLRPNLDQPLTTARGVETDPPNLLSKR